jgi:Ser/Thr protein kinase RdoA (MazF antagonist)
LLDTEAFVAALRRKLPAAGLRTARITYIKYKPRTNCLISYRLEFAEAAVTATAKAYPHNPRLRLGNTQNTATALSSWRSGCLFFDDCAVLVSMFPNDRAIKSLRRLPDAHARRRLIRHVLGRNRSELWEGTIEELAYKPERRYVAKLSAAEEPRAVLKFYAERNYRTASSNAWLFQSRETLRLAPRIGDSDRYGVLAFEWLPGQLLSHAMLDPNLDADAMRAVGAAIAELHAQNAKELAHRAPETEASLLVGEANWLGFLCPYVSKRAGDLARKLALQLMDQPPVSSPIHGDLHAGQVLLAGHYVGLLDLDRAMRANPMNDIGLLVAHLDREVVRGRLTAGCVERLAASLLEGYARTAGTSSLPAVPLYRAAGLLRLAPEFFRHCEPDWSSRIESLLEHAEKVLRPL